MPETSDNGVVRSVCLLLACCGGLFAASEDITPRVGIVQVFGTHKVSAQKVQSALNLQPGGVLPKRDDVEKRIAKVSGVVASSMEAVCCAGHGMVLYLGVEEKNAPHLNFHATPTSDTSLDPDLFAQYNAVLDAVSASLRGHNADEDLTSGYSLLADPEGRQLQQNLLPAVAANLPVLNQVVRESGDPEQRAAAAYLLQYAPRAPRESKVMSDALQYALQDPDASVRVSALTALRAVLVGIQLHPKEGVHLEATWFVELMNSLQWSDRRNASLALVTLTEKREASTLALLRERALSSVLDMAGWQDLEHALPGFILAGRLAGLSEADIHASWVGGHREEIIKELRKRRS